MKTVKPLIKEKLIERFAYKILIDEPEKCWNWIGSFLKTGYGDFQVGSKGRASHFRQKAHRFSYEYFKGPIPDGMYVCHSCDNPKCVNPEHLWVGTVGENTRDAKTKGRLHSGESKSKLQKEISPKGERHYRSRLNEEIINEIRMKKADVPFAFFAKKYEICESAIRKIFYRKTWKHID